jgi:peroxidase
MGESDMDNSVVAGDANRGDPNRVINYPVNGAGNDPLNPTIDEAGGDMTRIAPPNFAPGTDNVPVSGPNPREISNLVVAGNGAQADLPDPSGLSGMMYAFGQFIDHDLELNPDTQPSPANNINITVPDGDPDFAPGSTIALTRNVVDPSNGDAKNAVTGWLDLSQVYGSDQTTATDLRGPEGTLKTSAGNNLPIVNGAFEAGDSRVTENPDLTAVQTLFLREHNFWANKIHQQDPSLISDQIYDRARAIVTAEYQNIVFSEFLPHLVGPNTIPAYQGYDASANPQITEEFAGAAFRFGHSIVSDSVEKIDNDGNVLQSESLAGAFFDSPSQFESADGADGLLRHLAGDSAQKEDVYIINSLRNLLVDTPDGQDLAAINIERGRDLGLGTLNETREALQLRPYTSFDQITSDPVVAANLKKVYGSVNNVELWIGGLAENHAPGALVGPTFQAIIAHQFESLRDGDPLFFQNQPFSPDLMNQIENTTLSDLILRNTDTTNLQPDAFIDTPRQPSDTAASGPAVPQPVSHAGGKSDDNAVASANNATVTGLANNAASSAGGGHKIAFLGSDHASPATDSSGHAKPDLATIQTSPSDFSSTPLRSAAVGQANDSENSSGDNLLHSGVHVAHASDTASLAKHLDGPTLTQHGTTAVPG